MKLVFKTRQFGALQTIKDTVKKTPGLAKLSNFVAKKGTKLGGKFGEHLTKHSNKYAAGAMGLGAAAAVGGGLYAAKKIRDRRRSKK